MTLDRRLSDGGIDSVVADNETATAAAIDHLIGLGHRRIAFLGSVRPEEPPTLRIGNVRASVAGPARPSLERVRGCLRALSAAGIHADRDLIALVPHDEPKRREHAVETMLDTERPPDRAVHRRRLHDEKRVRASVRAEHRDPRRALPDGFDDLEWTTLVRPRISVDVQPSYDMGRAAADSSSPRWDAPARWTRPAEAAAPSSPPASSNGRA
ncbi:hypothetical protein GCM10023196_022090 [Actinoallomurus vinaceus]|uniref:LacI family transcriptional regulator n=1 Tax=Actinoallomurus vinaceus TaxID=1080074 RepID=A0ABP8U716_9ACTN